MSTQETFLVRLRPQNPRKGLKLGRFLAFGIKFEVSRGWYKVSRYTLYFNEENGTKVKLDLVEYLKAVRNDNDDPESPLAFDVCTPAEAAAMQLAEKKAKEAADAKAENPNPVDMMGAALIEEDEEPAKKPVIAKVKRPRGRPPKAKPVQAEADAE